MAFWPLNCRSRSNQGMTRGLRQSSRRLMREAGVAFADLDRVAIVVGPGSFTGVRVGVAFARGLSLSLDIPAVGVTSLEAIDGVPPQGYVLGLLPAKRRPPHRTWWGQLVDAGRGGAGTARGQRRRAACAGHGNGMLCAGVLAICLDWEHARSAGAPSARAAALFAARLADSDLPPPRPVYVREPDATPMRPPVKSAGQ